MRTSILLLSAAVAVPGALRAQDGAGTSGAGVLQLLAGSRAAALSGAYTAAAGDADVLFYNPAGLASLRAALSASYQRHVEDIGLTTASAAVRLGGLTYGVSVAYLDYGDIPEIVPDPDVGGQVGMPTGTILDAAEFAGRVGAAGRIGDRFRLGAGGGIVSVRLAGIARTSFHVDAGAQYASGRVTIGAAIRNLGPSLSGDNLGDADLPAEARLGATFDLPGAGRLGALLSADFVARLGEGGSGVVAGIEAGYRPTDAQPLGAVARIGYNGALGSDGLGALQLGAGLVFDAFGLDYAYQDFDYFGAVHRFGLRWATPR